MTISTNFKLYKIAYVISDIFNYKTASHFKWEHAEKVEKILSVS